MDLKELLRADMAAAMRAGETDKRNTLRMLLAAVKQVEVDEQKYLDEKDVQSLLMKQAKQRRESIVDYAKAGRTDLADKESMELAFIESYLPKMMDKAEIEAIARKLISDLGVSDSKGMGQVMGKLMPAVKGKADGRLVNEVVRGLLK